MRVSYGFPLVAVVCFCSLGWAQQREERREERREVRREERPVAGRLREAVGAVQNAVGSPDEQIAAFLYSCVRNEVEIAKIGAEKGANEEVRNFAARMVKDHTMCMDKLQKTAGPLVSAHAPGSTAAAVKQEVIKEETANPQRDAATVKKAAPREIRRVNAEERVVEAAVAGTAGLDWANIHKQIADQCLATAKAELGQKDGAEFDQCFMGQQIMGHMQLIAELKVLSLHASAGMQKDLEESRQKAVSHLEQAKKIAEDLQNSSERVSSKPKTE